MCGFIIGLIVVYTFISWILKGLFWSLKFVALPFFVLFLIAVIISSLKPKSKQKRTNSSRLVGKIIDTEEVTSQPVYSQPTSKPKPAISYSMPSTVTQSYNVVTRGAVGRMYLLLSACLPSNSHVLHRRIVEEITETNEYRQLINLPVASEIVSEKYSKAVLSTLDVEGLKSAKHCIPLLLAFFTTLINCVRYGEAWKLTEHDMPDMYSATSLEKTLEKIQVIGTSENVTNIDETTVLRIFERSTVKDVNTFLSYFDYRQINNIFAVIPSVMGNQLYCLNADVLKLELTRANALLSGAETVEYEAEFDERILLARKQIIIFTLICLYVLLSYLFPLNTIGTFIVWACGITFSVVYYLWG